MLINVIVKLFSSKKNKSVCGFVPICKESLIQNSINECVKNGDTEKLNKILNGIPKTSWERHGNLIIVNNGKFINQN